MRARTLLLLSLALLAASCVQLRWQRLNLNAPLDDNLLLQLQPDRSDLGDCLRALGAPHQVWESRGGIVLAYGWLDQANWSVSVSYSFTRFVSASFNYGDIDRNLNGVVLLLDQDLRLRSIRRGYLADITADLQPRPTAVIE